MKKRVCDVEFMGCGGEGFVTGFGGSTMLKKNLCVCVRTYVIRNTKNLVSAPILLSFFLLFSFLFK